MFRKISFAKKQNNKNKSDVHWRRKRGEVVLGNGLWDIRSSICHHRRDQGYSFPRQERLPSALCMNSPQFTLISWISPIGRLSSSNSFRQDENGKSWEKSWSETLEALLGEIPREICARVASISIDGTSATTLIMDRCS